VFVIWVLVERFKAHTLVRHLSGGICIQSLAIRDKRKGALMKRKKNIRRLLRESFERGIGISGMRWPRNIVTADFITHSLS
jgi:hypothetical protein